MDEILTEFEVAQRWKTNMPAISALIKAGRLQAFSLAPSQDSDYRIRMSDVLEFENASIGTHAKRLKIVKDLKRSGDTIRESAKRLGVSMRTAHRAKECAEAVARLPIDVRRRIETGELSTSVRALAKLRKLGASEVVKVAEASRLRPQASLGVLITMATTERHPLFGSLSA